MRRQSKSIELMNRSPRNMETECLPSDPTIKIQSDGGGSKFVKKRHIEVRLPKKPMLLLTGWEGEYRLRGLFLETLTVSYLRLTK